MARKYEISGDLYAYAVKNSVREPSITVELRDETFKTERAARMVSSPEQMQFISMLLKLTRPQKCLEIGVFTGYSALWIAMALQKNATLIGVERNPRYEKICRKYWEKAGVEEKIDLRIASAHEALDALILNGESNTFDFIYIDADKLGYKDYYEKCLKLLKKDALMIFDNVFLFGEVVNEKSINPALPEAMCEFNEFIHNDKRIEISMLPLGDGMTLAYKC